MNFISILVVVFVILGGFDRIIGGKFGLAKEFEKGFMVLGVICLSMIGMIVISPFIAQVLKPVLNFVHNVFKIDPSVITASLFANDMGGAPLSQSVAFDKTIGMFNGLVVSSMMGATISFTIPLAVEVVSKDCHRELFLGILCGIITIPVGCFVSGLICKIPIVALLVNLLPLTIFAVFIAISLILWTEMCVKVFKAVSFLIRFLITTGLILGIIRYLTGVEIIKNLVTIEEGFSVCFNVSIVMAGMFPLMYIVSKIISKPLSKMGTLLKINKTSVMGFISSLVTNVTTFEMMNGMDKKGIMLNSAFAVSASFVFAGHLAFTLAFDASYILAVITGKLVSGILALLLAMVIYRIINSEKN